MLARSCVLALSIFLVVSTPVWGDEIHHLWSQSFGYPGDQYTRSVAIDKSGNTIIMGNFYGSLDFGGGLLASSGNNDVYLAKFDPNGNHLWSQHFGDSGDQYAEGVAVDRWGNIIITGEFVGSVDFGGNVLTSVGAHDIYLAKFGPNGDHIWSQGFGDPTDQFAASVAIDGEGNILIMGDFEGSVDFGTGVLTSAGSRDIYTAKFGPLGSPLGSLRFGDASGQFSSGVVIDELGNGIFLGVFEGSIDFGGGPLTSNGHLDIFLAKIGPGGVHLWSQRFGDSDYQFARGVAVDGWGNIIITGSFGGTVDFGGGPRTSAGGYDLYLAKHSPDGIYLWDKAIGDTGEQFGVSVVADGAQNVIFTGGFVGTVNFGGEALTSAGSHDVFVAGYDHSGNHLGSQRFGDWESQAASGLAVGETGTVAILGTFKSTIDFGGETLVSAGSDDIFVASFTPPPEPLVSSISDITGDQGSQVRINFSGSARDIEGSPTPIVQYEAFRRIDEAPPITGGITSREDRPAMRSDAGILLEGWEFVAAVPAHTETDYHLIAPTLFDSTQTHGMHWSVFFIRAATAVPEVFFDSPPDSGYSLDNLAPGVPAGFVIAYNWHSNILEWEGSEDEDFQYFRVYRSDNPALDVIDPPVDTTWAVVHSTIGTTWTDDTEQGWRYRYRLTALDHAGNESDPAWDEAPTAVGGPVIPEKLILYQNVPNPFNPTTRIQYDVPGGGASVTLRVFDASGRLVKTLVDGEVTPGRKTATWDGKNGHGDPVSSGVYFYRLTAGDQMLTKKLVVLR